MTVTTSHPAKTGLNRVARYYIYLFCGKLPCIVSHLTGVVAMDVGNFVRATVSFQLLNASNPVVMVWDWECTQATGSWDLTGEGLLIAEALIERHYTPLTTIFSTAAQMTGISLRAWEFPADGFDLIGALWAGTNTAKMLPPFVTLAMQLTRQNYAMRNGRKAYPGPCIDILDTDGEVLPSIVESIAVYQDAWATTDMFIEGSVDFTLSPRIIRVPTAANTDPTVYSRISAYGPVYFGTQNTRKK